MALSGKLAARLLRRSQAPVATRKEGGRGRECSPRQRLIRSEEAALRPLARREPPIPDVAKQALQLQAGGGLGDTVDSNVLKHTTKSHWFLTFPFTLDAD